MAVTTSEAAALKRTALNAVHRAAGGKMVEFAGWEMPVEYSGIVSEHVAVRTAAGLFDVSHMGEIDVRGSGALALLQHVTSNDVSKLALGQAQYTALMDPRGSAIDDCLVHRLGDDHYLLCVNASNTGKDFDWIASHNTFGASVENVSDRYAQLALQGPKAAAILARLTHADLSGIRYYWFRQAACCGVEGILARTGYTGEDGFEFYFDPQHAEEVWRQMVRAGTPDGLIPAGLGARNTLRLEAGYALYGHELDEETTLLEANLGWICKLDKGDFLGRDVLARQKRDGVGKKLIGIEMLDRAIARDGYPVWSGGECVGRVTSGSYAPFLRKNIGMAYVSPGCAETGREIEIEIRARRVPAKIVALPFYKRAK
jgi:glycine cleavage system T protein (aminomethyltransferase)